MTCEQFNKKWENYLEPMHYGVDINIVEVLDYLDNEFQNLIKNKNFSYSQIKIKYGACRIYCKGVNPDIVQDIEIQINKILINFLNSFIL